jgi:hypothetical protein
MKQLNLTIYATDEFAADRVIDGLNDSMLLMVDEGWIHHDLTQCGEPGAEPGELGWAWRKEG